MKFFKSKTEDVFDYIENQYTFRYVEWKRKSEKMGISVLQAIAAYAVPFCECTSQDVKAIGMRLDKGEKPKTILQAIAESAVPFCGCTSQYVKAIGMRLDKGKKPKTIEKKAIGMRLDKGKKPKTIEKRDIRKLKKGLSKYTTNA